MISGSLLQGIVSSSRAPDLLDRVALDDVVVRRSQVKTRNRQVLPLGPSVARLVAAHQQVVGAVSREDSV